VANHVRRQIREAIATAVTGLTTTGARVYQSRVYPLADANLPCLLVFSTDETSTAETIHAPVTLARDLRVQVTAYAKAVADLDDTLDLICKEVETALMAPPAAVIALARSIVLSATRIDMQGTSEKPVGRAAMSFDLQYFTAGNAPDVAL